MFDRYARQLLFEDIGREGQTKLSESCAVIIGCGALGTSIAMSLVRSGVGKIRIIDRDFIEHHNLQRQILFTEEDVKQQIPKAVAAERYLKRVNSSIEIEGVVADVNFTNVERLVKDADVIVDGLDNFETRLLINDVSLKLGIPWVYGAAISSIGMSRTILPGETSCFRCLLDTPPGRGQVQTCDTVGVLNPAPMIIGAFEAVEAIKILVGRGEINRGYLMIDVWEGTFEKLDINHERNCPACAGRYDFLEGEHGLKTTSLCGQNAVQILNPGTETIDFRELSERLNRVGQTTYNEFLLRFQVDDYEMVIFPDGRAIVNHTNDESVARGLYAKYIGT